MSVTDFGQGTAIPVESLRRGVTRELVPSVLRTLLALPVELVVPAQGAPTGRAAHKRALADC
jgi:hypothetical protein